MPPAPRTDRPPSVPSSKLDRPSFRPAAPGCGWVAAALIAGCASVPAPAPQAPSAPALRAQENAAAAEPGKIEAPSVDERFGRWLEGFRQMARTAGIDETTLHAALDGVRLKPATLDRDRVQPEFTRSVWDYLDATVSPQRVAAGLQRRSELTAEIDAASARYGVPGDVLLAVWGMESNYGANFGDVSVFDALASLGFEGRREGWARAELLAALKILQRGEIERDRMIGSWAGAMGQTQFLPSSYLASAVDADGDGRRDIWGSMADVLASTANFLARAGWRADEPWGAEVRLPAGFDPARADPALRQASAQWAAEGVRTPDDAALPPLADASILLPAGARGPAFIVGRNFLALLRYNNSTSYALAVGLLAQRLGGGPAVQAAWPRELQALSRSEMQALQSALNGRGFASGAADGQMGPATRNALRQFQRSQGLPADGYPTLELLGRLQQAP
jgi:membrane-bound lytic murein transglycosylase B